MIKLCGFALSNYYNKVKFVLLEKGIPFEEVVVMPGQDEATLCRTALGKVPFIETPMGTLTESQAIVDYLEAAYPQTPLLPADPFAAAKQRELITYLELHLELLARELYGQAFFGAEVSEYMRERVQKKLPHHLKGFLRIATFSPYLGGKTFGLADIVASIHLPIIALATKAVFGQDFVLDAGIDWKTYAKLVGLRPAAQQVEADRRAFIEKNKQPDWR